MDSGSQIIATQHTDIIHDAQMDYYGKKLATCSSDKTIKVFNVIGDQHSLVGDLLGHDGPVWEVAWAHPRFGTLLASCSYDRKVIIWKEETENQWIQQKIFTDHEASVNSISFAPHELGLILACASSDGTISILSFSSATNQWQASRIEHAHPAGVTSVSWAPASPLSLEKGTEGPLFTPRFVSGGCDNTVKVWKYSEGKWIMDCFPALQHSDWVRDVAWAPNMGLPKTTIASASQDCSVIIWTQDSESSPWKKTVLKVFSAPVWRVSWSLTGNFLAVADSSNIATLWKELADGKWVEVGKLAQ